MSEIKGCQNVQSIVLAFSDVAPDSKENHLTFPADHLSITTEVIDYNPNWLKKHFTKICIGTFALSAVVTAAMNPIEIQRQAIEAAPWVGGGLVVSESLWAGGAALMLSSAGKRIGNPLKIRSRWKEVKAGTSRSKVFRTGLHANTIGAVGTASVIAGGAATSLPPETWPGAFGLAAADIAGTVAVRAPLYRAIKKTKEKEASKEQKVSVRTATLKDIYRLADIDLLLFRRAYGEELPPKEKVVYMLTKRLTNNPEGMLVAEVDGEVEGFVSAFRTNRAIEEFVSWEDSTSNGTLDEKVDPKGRYIYVTNMSIKRDAVKLGAEEMLLANLLANAVEDGADYAYFVSRMPQFKRWADREVRKGKMQPFESPDKLQAAAEHYFEMRDENGKRFDRQLRMYEEFGYKLERLVAGAFKDDASYDYGVVCKADIPPDNILKRVKFVRKTMAGAIRLAARSPKVAKKLF